MAVGDVWGFFRDGDLDGGGTPGNEFCNFTFAHAQEGFVYLVFCLLLVCSLDHVVCGVIIILLTDLLRLE